MRILYSLLALTLLPILASAQTSAPPLIETEAEFATILDFETGAVLFSKNGDTLMTPASMTKMMTAQVVFDRLRRGEIRLTDTFRTSENAWRKGGWQSGGSTMGLAIDDEPTVEELLRGVIILSGNDACIVLAEGLAGTEEAFAREMTALARDLGLDSATFENATGLYGENHRISANDLAKLAKIQIEQYPEFYAFYNERSYEWRGISQPNRNPLLGKVRGVDGLKTGHLEISGYGLTSSGVQNGERRIVVLNGLDSEAKRGQESERMMRLAFTSFETRVMEPSSEPLTELPVWMGVQRSVPVGLETPLVISGHKRAFDDVQTEIVFNGPLEAPISVGARIGEVIVTLPGQAPVRTGIVALRDVRELGYFGRVSEGLNQILTGGNDNN
ncbi:MAG: D-alanyl-D-alanine carboxypeptidase family protein [Hyphomonadaceae bacterium]